MDKKQQESGMETQDLNDTVKILDKMVNFHISNINILDPANNILDERNEKSWKNMKVSCICFHNRLYCNSGRMNKDGIFKR